jgi:preprotein translocase subunit SecG
MPLLVLINPKSGAQLGSGMASASKTFFNDLLFSFVHNCALTLKILTVKLFLCSFCLSLNSYFVCGCFRIEATIFELVVSRTSIYH